MQKLPFSLEPGPETSATLSVASSSSPVPEWLPLIPGLVAGLAKIGS